MSTFYVMPPRSLLVERLVNHFKGIFPGIDLTRMKREDLLSWLDSTATRQPDVFLVYREELAIGEETSKALKDGFGAEAGDEVIELRPSGPAGFTERRWRLAA